MLLFENPKYIEMIREEFTTKVFDFTLSERGQQIDKWMRELNYDKIYELSFFSQCFNEAMRLAPAAIDSTAAELTETCQIKDVIF